MNFNELVKYFEKIDAEAGATPRRSMLKELGVKAAMASLPFAAGTLFTNKAYGQSKETLINILNYLLKYEYLHESLYTKALGTNNLLLESYLENYQRILDNSKAHISSMQTLITDLGGAPYMLPEDDIDLTGGYGTGGGPFVKAYDNRGNFQVLAQFFADAGVRIYKGQVSEVLSDKITVQTIMNIHSVKAREAAFVRFMRLKYDNTDIKPWITGTNSDTSNTAVQRAYAGEAITSQNNINLIGINGFEEVDVDVATEAFDEPMNSYDGNNILDRFIKL